ncbi:RNA polymerase sigma factor [Luteolibacter sp. AS25]|uniref:RNA polymerase sigma factor n=1 Tax=Luteolibacter sp. AS25 TaxID=3135776 RepID=UPI00398B6356
MSEFVELVDAHYEALYRFGYSLTRSPDRAADLVQETFCIWAAKNAQLRDRSKAKTWLFTTLHREFLGQRRKMSRFSDEPLDETMVNEAGSNDDEAERQMDGQRAVEILADMDEMYRAPLALFYLQQHSYKEIAEILEVPIGTVMSRLSRGKGMLRKKMVSEPSSGPRNLVDVNPELFGKNHG